MRSRVSSPTSCLFTLASLASLSHAITLTPVPSPDLDLSQLGRTGIAGDFSGISLYEWVGQNEQPFTANGSETLMTQLPNGQFISILAADASIQAMCTFQGALILGGNFTSLGGDAFAAIAALDLNTTQPSPLTGLSGQVNALLCDEDAKMVYVGGSFQAGNLSANAITWVGNQGWTSLPFAGFNGPVTSIVKAANGHIIFGGSFTGLGNTSTPNEPDEQVINLSTADISAEQSSTTAGFSDPKNIVCKTSGADGSGNTWLLEDNTAGSWQAKFNFGFEPTKLRLYNTHQDGRGTKTWRYTALPINGIMNFTYVDPATQRNMSCTSECPLSSNSSIEYQDFYFVNQVGMNEFRLDISAWYGSGGGLNGIELFQDDIYAYAVSDFNEPNCGGVSFPSTATSTGPWTVSPSGQSNSEYLTAQLNGTATSAAASVTFFPDIRASGNYSISMFTPGCIQDDTCLSRGQVNVTFVTTADGDPGDNIKIVYQTNNFDKYDVLFDNIEIDAASDSFRPRVILTPANGQTLLNQKVVAQRVGFGLVNSSGGLNGLFEYDPSKATVDTADFTSSAFDKLGSSFSTRSAVASLVVDGDLTYIGGNFSSSSVKNIVAINTDRNSTVDLDGGLNGAVWSMHASEGQIFVGGQFNNTLDGSDAGLSHVAAYDTASSKWSALGAGVDGPVTRVAAMLLNITNGSPEEVITLTGSFRKVRAFGSNAEIAVDGFAVWVKSQRTWLQNVNATVPSIDGILTTSLFNVSDGTSLYAGSLTSQAISANGVVTMGETLGTFPVTFKTQSQSTNGTTGSASIAKRQSVINSTESVTGVTTGAFYESGDRNITVLAGHFSASATNGADISNLVLIDGAKDNTVTGLPSGVSDESRFFALAIHDDTLFAGGVINGSINGNSINGLISYNLADATFNTQPPALAGGRGVVSTIAVRPDSGDVYVGGSFRAAGSLGCPGVCVFSTSTSQWNRPGVSFEGDVNSMIWPSSSTMIAGGDLKVNNTPTYLASYDPSSSTWSSFASASALPGPVDAVTVANSEGSQLWAAGTEATSSSVYLMKYDGSSWRSAGISLDQETVISSLQVFTVTSSHDSSDLVAANQVLMITGSLVIPGFGTASSALFNGTTLQPYALTGNSLNSAGSIAKIFVQNQNFFTSAGGGGLALGFVVLIALAISLGLMLLIVVAGLLLDRYRKKRDGYIPAPTSMYDRGTGMRRISPHELLDSLGKGRAGAPHI
ncbi:hypothetical protein JX265_008911 [Neoarthrinium moseri]|uniref:Cellular morphogenesis protein n=1 Tax=Neoarthrinium moseri TaxID=1658444 RepID=A0A9Q0AN05_9PEZI|nr:hypothetical protein JX265_008911 [Neoarthrinium moseri]